MNRGSSTLYKYKREVYDDPRRIFIIDGLYHRLETIGRKRAAFKCSLCEEVLKTTEEKMTEADAAFADAPVMSAAGALAKMQELKALVISPELDVDEKGLDVRHLETVVTFLEGGPGGAAPDPAVASFAKLKAASAAFDALPDEVDEQVDEAAYKRFSGAREAVYDVVPVSLAGVAAKVRAMVEYHSDTYEKSPGLDRTVESMLPFLEGGAAALPPTVAEPDPIVALFNEWGPSKTKRRRWTRRTRKRWTLTSKNSKTNCSPDIARLRIVSSERTRPRWAASPSSCGSCSILNTRCRAFQTSTTPQRRISTSRP